MYAQSKKISEVSYYKVTTRFVNEVTAGYSNDYGGGNFENLKVSVQCCRSSGCSL